MFSEHVYDLYCIITLLPLHAHKYYPFQVITLATVFLAPAIVDPGDNTTTGTTDGGIDYFQTTCEAFSSQVLIELKDIRGSSFFYASASVKNPGPLTTNTVSNTTTGITRKTAVLHLGRKKVSFPRVIMTVVQYLDELHV